MRGYRLIEVGPRKRHGTFFFSVFGQGTCPYWSLIKAVSHVCVARCVYSKICSNISWRLKLKASLHSFLCDHIINVYFVYVCAAYCRITKVEKLSVPSTLSLHEQKCFARLQKMQERTNLYIIYKYDKTPQIVQLFWWYFISST